MVPFLTEAASDRLEQVTSRRQCNRADAGPASGDLFANASALDLTDLDLKDSNGVPQTPRLPGHRLRRGGALFDKRRVPLGDRIHLTHRHVDLFDAGALFSGCRCDFADEAR